MLPAAKSMFEILFKAVYVHNLLLAAVGLRVEIFRLLRLGASDLGFKGFRVVGFRFNKYIDL